MMAVTTDAESGAGPLLPTAELLVSGAGAAWLCLQAESVPAPSMAMRGIATALALVPLVRLRQADSGLARLAAVAASVFLATGAMTLPLAYDQPAALGKLLMLVGGTGLAVGVATQPSGRLVSAARLFVLAACGLSAYFIATNEWFAPPVKFHPLATVGQALGRLLPDLPGPRIHPNVVAGLLASLSPWTVVWWRRTAGAGRALPLAASALLLIALGLTASRAAWVALAVVGVAWWTLHRTSARTERPASKVLSRVAAIAATAAVAVGLFVVVSGAVPESLERFGRLSVQRRALVLVRDYLFTGAGLGTFPLQLAIYGQSGTSAGSVHAHNTAIDVMVEQGIGGLVSALFVGLITVGAGWRARQNDRARTAGLAEGALAAALVIAVHGLFDDTLYASRGAVVLFVPVGFALAAYRDAAPQMFSRPAIGWVALPALVVTAGAVALVPSGRAMWQANLGALSQAGEELPRLDRSRLDSPTIDQVRGQTPLAVAIASFERALTIDVANPTASRRLAAILLSRARYDAAWRAIAPSLEAGASDYATRAVAADALVATGRIEDAAVMLRDDPLAVDRLLSIAWYRYWIAGDRVRAADAWRTVLVLEPGQAMAAEWLDIALTRPDWVNR